MAVRNCKEVGENLQIILKRLMANDNLVKLLYYTDKDPLSKPNLTDEEKKEFIFNKLIKIVPRTDPIETAQSIISLRVVRGNRNRNNDEFRDIIMQIEVFVPLTQWMIKGTNLRPFSIMGEVQESLIGKKINGLGKIVGGDFSINFLTDEISSYELTFAFITYD